MEATGTIKPSRAAAGLLPLYAVTIFLSAFLLFSVQPMFTKMVTPSLGGTPAVWSIAMVFFQAVLLGGYAYAHILSRFLQPRDAGIFHLALMLVVIGVGLPIALSQSIGDPPSEGHALWLITLFLLSVGLPFFAVSANGPLLQAWFSRTGHAQANDPYFLYGASNFGSFLALLAYPLLIEPSLGLGAQASLWGQGFMLLAAAISVVVLASLAFGAAVGDQGAQAAKPHEPTQNVSSNQILSWLAYAAVPSGLLIAATQEITTDVAAVPLLWVLPLAAYLLAFTVAFSATGERQHGWYLQALPYTLIALVACRLVFASSNFAITVAAHIAFFFNCAMVCHGELYKRRPAANQLTLFYFILSLGGIIGGIFASLVAPMIFNANLEYPILAVAALCCTPALTITFERVGWRVTALIAAAIGALYVVLFTTKVSFAFGMSGAHVVSILALLACGVLALSREAPIRGLIAASIAVGLVTYRPAAENLVQMVRSFFAVHVVKQTPDQRGRILSHGTTVHGAEWFHDTNGKVLAGRPDPVSYFFKGGNYDTAIESIRTAAGGRLSRVAVVGLGMGALACSSKDGESWDFYEIDSEVVRIAKDPSLFRSMSVCAPNAKVIVGDGRLTLAKATGKYDLIILDAFSSNSVPVHLLTVEAVRIYLSKLNARGILLFNISNRYLSLEGTVAGSAAANSMLTYQSTGALATGLFTETLKAEARVAVAARDIKDLGPLASSDRWERVEPVAPSRVWRDDFSNIIDPFLRQRERMAGHR